MPPLGFPESSRGGRLEKYVLCTMSSKIDDPKPPENPKHKLPDALSLGRFEVPALALTEGSRAFLNFKSTIGVKHSLSKKKKRKSDRSLGESKRKAHLQYTAWRITMLPGFSLHLTQSFDFPNFKRPA